MKKVLIIFAMIFVLSCTNVIASTTEGYDINTATAEIPQSKITEENVYVSSFKNDDKVSNNAGEQEINVVSSYCTTTEFEVVEIDENGTLVNDSCESNYDSAAKQVSHSLFNNNNAVVLHNNEIVYANEAIAYSVGGYDTKVYIYPSVTEAASEVNGVAISGGGFDMAYLGTEMYKEEIFYHVQVSGLDGYITSDSAQIIPIEFVEYQSYYTVENDELVYYALVDPLTGGYSRLVIGPANPLMEDGVKYYSYDDINYYTTPLTTSDSKASPTMTNYTYWQWLPLRSTSNYEPQDYKDYLTYIGCNDGNGSTGSTSACGGTQGSTTAGASEFYNETDGFTMAEDKYGINSTLLFSMASIESAYGSSTLARKCHNFFGWAAYDSNPEMACSVENNGVDFSEDDQIDDAIQAQAINLSESFLDIADYCFYGMHLGNKSSGLNVMYASDPDWGKHIASTAYNVDAYLGGLETGYFKLVKTTSKTEMYKYSEGTEMYSVTDNLNNDGVYSEYPYVMEQGGVQDSDNDYVEMPLLVAQEANGRYRVTIPTPIKQADGETCANVNASSGYAPTFTSSNPIAVSTADANFSCMYNWGYEYAWIDISDVTTINNVPPRDINSKYTIRELPTPLLVETNKPYVETYFDDTITNSGSEIVATHVVTDNSNKLVGYVFNPNPSSTSYDAVWATDVKDISTSESVNLGWTESSSLNGSNMKVYQSPSTTSTQVDTIMYTNEPIAIIGTGTQGESVNGNSTWSTVIYNPMSRYNGYASNNYIQQFSPTSYVGYNANTSIDSSGTIHLNGYAYIQYMNASSNSSINHSVVIKNSSGNVVKEVAATDTNEYKNTMTNHENYMYNYDYSGYDISINLPSLNLANGTYTINIKVDQGAELVTAPLKLNSGQSYDKTITYNNKNYRLYTENGALKFTISNTPNSQTGSAKKVTFSDNGYSFINYSYIPSAESVSHTLTLDNTTNNNVASSIVLTDTNEYAAFMSSNYENGKYNYDYSGYNKTINIPSLNLADGTYKLNMTTSSNGTTVKNFLYVPSNITLNKTVKINMKEYKVYTQNNALYINVKSIPIEQSNSMKSITMDAVGNITVEGYGYIKTLDASSESKINHYLTIKDVNGNKAAEIKMTDSNKYVNLMNSSHEYGVYNYDYSSYYGSFNINSLNLPVGSYTFYMTLSESGVVDSEPITLSSGVTVNKSYNASNKIYHLYSSGSSLKLDVTDSSMNPNTGSNKEVTMSNTGVVTLNGYAYSPFTYIGSASNIKHRIQFVKDGVVAYSFETTDTNTYASLMESSHEQGKYVYDYSGYKVSIDLDSLNMVPGEYDIYINTSASGTVNTSQLKVDSGKSFAQSITYNGYTYDLYTVDGLFKLDVTKNSEIENVNSLKGVSMDANGVVSFDGYAYQKSYDASSASKINHYVQLMDVNGNKVAQSSGTDTNKYESTTNSHEGGIYNYNYASYSAKFDVTTFSLPEGVYQFNIATSQSGDTLSSPIKVNSGLNYSNTITKNGLNYKVYTSSDELFLEVY